MYVYVCVCPDSLLSDLYQVIDDSDALIDTKGGHLSPPSPPVLHFLTLLSPRSLISSPSPHLNLLDLLPVLSFAVSPLPAPPPRSPPAFTA